MATILLGTAGRAIGSLFGPVGAIIGQAAGALAGAYLDQQIVNALTPPVRREGPRLTSTDIQTGTEGAGIDRVFGRARVTGHVIWATRFEEEVVTDTSGGGKGGGGPRVTTTTYKYFGNLAIGLCEGPVAGIGRIWADGEEIDQTLIEFRSYLGGETQAVDPLIEAKESEAPAYRGLCYLVFERLLLEEWGNRLPQISAEIFKSCGDLEEQVAGVAIIAGNEFGFDTDPVKQTSQSGAPVENRHTLVAQTDFEASIDRLLMLAPNLNSVLLVATWFGDDLRCGSCTIRPKVDSAAKVTSPHAWKVGPLVRATAQTVTLHLGVPSSGGTPNDASLIRAIQNLNARGLKVCLLPFMIMDIATGNVLPNPYSNNASGVGQPAYPWRGRITVSPAAGFAGTVDKTATAATQITAFLGVAAPGDFGGAGVNITYAGPNEWSYCRFILHHAKLAQLAGGVDAFLIGSEMIGLTRARSSASTYPFVTALKTLAADCRTLLGGSVDIGYAADWSEYHSHAPGDGTGDLFFNLDPLWSDADIDFVGIDNYFPLADWRAGSQHLDYDPAGDGSGPTTIHDRGYLEGNVEGGEYYDWFYASEAARDAQTRTVIADGAYGKPWVFRAKDIRNWWLNAHFDRPAGIEAGAPTGWVAQGKPVRFIELGCAAVDKAANQPNVFVDAKSSESFYPHYSSQARDDAMQRAWLGAMLGWWTDNNPVSGVYAGPMIDLENSHVWAWDARPWPDFPLFGDWGDAPNWEAGHWLNGRLGSAPASETIRDILEAAGFTDFAIEPIPMTADGVTTGGLVSPRSMLDALRPVFQFDAVESDGVVKFISRLGRAPVAAVAGAELVVEEGNVIRFKQTRGQETELPGSIRIKYGDPARDDQPAAVEARRSAGGALRTIEYSLPALVAENIARGIAEHELHSAWVGRERAEMTLPPSRLALDPGDVIDFAPTQRQLRIAGIADGAARGVEAFQFDPLALAPVAMPKTAGRKQPQELLLAPVAALIDGPLLGDDHLDHAGYMAGTMLPFRSGMAAWRSPSTSGYVLDTVLALSATIGETTADLYSGPLWRWDRVTSLYLKLYRGTLQSADELLVLNGANALLVQNQDGEWELLQFATATPNGALNYILTGLLRGQLGTEHAMRNPAPSGARIVLADAALRQTGIPTAQIGLALNWRIGPADRDIGSADFADQAFTFNARARRPLAPVQLRGSRDPATGDWMIAWTRRSRIGADSWDQVEIPLGETSEAYRLEILAGQGGALKRGFDTAAASQLYTAAQQTADFGAAQYSFWARVAQKSPTFGNGIFGEELVWVRTG